jgi:hypothetical protein
MTSSIGAEAFAGRLNLAEADPEIARSLMTPDGVVELAMSRNPRLRRRPEALDPANAAATS